ncbi:hypothetical protein ACIP5Y_36450 [Nocardia sp. NPDC088792]|uniref:hypothetical protein n=1 Tax=Nocardia sp. NPDC088792 TaxID=3364332 RepID=UPI00381C28A2
MYTMVHNDAVHTLVASFYEAGKTWTGCAFRPHALRDGLLITGQQQHSGAAAARLIIQALGQ